MALATALHPLVRQGVYAEYGPPRSQTLATRAGEGGGEGVSCNTRPCSRRPPSPAGALPVVRGRAQREARQHLCLRLLARRHGVLQRTVEPIVETFMPVPILDVRCRRWWTSWWKSSRTFDTMLPVVAEQVIEVPKNILRERTALRDPQLVEQLVEVPTVTFFVKQTVDIQVQGGGGRRGEHQGPVRGQCPTACGGGGLQGLPPGQGSASAFLSTSFFSCCAKTLRRKHLTGFLALAPQPKKKREGRCALECESARALELVRASGSFRGLLCS